MSIGEVSVVHPFDLFLSFFTFSHTFLIHQGFHEAVV